MAHARQARGDHAGVVEHQQVAGSEQARQVGEAAVDVRCAGDVQQAAAGALGRRVLGDQFGGEGEVEVVDSQGHDTNTAGKQKRLSQWKAELSSLPHSGIVHRRGVSGSRGTIAEAVPARNFAGA
ncbi:hypothetical protein SDC9_171473 [bioreactor metagenome]|uniref:Uncharacterized protein n=1 Tax=bioreactor metagenome TaxID=1076179 RepID=A0A645GE74_9ZZZZ